MLPITWRQRVLRQVFPRRIVQDCCYHHKQDFHATTAVVVSAYSQVSRHGLEGEEADQLMVRLLDEANLTQLQG